MNTPVCQHPQSIEMICAQLNCLTPLCPKCVSSHHSESGHSLHLLLNEFSIEFFIQFTDFLIKKLNECVLLLNKDGFTKVFTINSSSFVSYNLNEIASHALQILKKYIVLLQNNISFVVSNKENMSILTNSQFLKDISQMFLLKWQFIGTNICQQIKTEINRAYPYRFSYKNLHITFTPTLIAQIEAEKQNRIGQIHDRILVSYEVLYEELIHRSVQAKVYQHIRNVPENFKLVDSFQEILEGSYSLNMNQKHILDESLQTFSPHYPQDGLQKQLEDLLIENERLKQENLRIRFQNKLLIEENNQLKKRII